MSSCLHRHDYELRRKCYVIIIWQLPFILSTTRLYSSTAYDIVNCHTQCEYYTKQSPVESHHQSLGEVRVAFLLTYLTVHDGVYSVGTMHSETQYNACQAHRYQASGLLVFIDVPRRFSSRKHTTAVEIAEIYLLVLWRGFLHSALIINKSNMPPYILHAVLSYL